MVKGQRSNTSNVQTELQDSNDAVTSSEILSDRVMNSKLSREESIGKRKGLRIELRWDN